MSSGSSRTRKLESGQDIIPVTPSDTVDLPDGECRCLYIDSSGTIKVITAAGNTRGPINVSAGTYLLVRCTRVFSTDTTATVWAVYNE